MKKLTDLTILEFIGVFLVCIIIVCGLAWLVITASIQYSEAHPRSNVECIHVDTFNERYKIEVYQKRHYAGLEISLDSHQDVILIRPKNTKGTNILNKLVNETIN